MNQNTHIKSLDGLRGIAVLTVIFSHTGNSNLYLLPHLNLSGIGQFGVILFFFLSSFLLSRPFFQYQENIYDYRKWVNYAVRRILRIIPMYYFVVLLDFFILKYNFPEHRIKDLYDHLLFIKGTSFYWTVPVEMQFYLVLPFFVTAFILCSKNRIALSVLISVILGYFILNGTYALTNSFWETLHIHRYVPCFITGIATSYFYVQTEKRNLQLFNKNTFEFIAVACALIMFTQIPSVWFHFKGMPYNFVGTDWAQYYKYRHLLAMVCISIMTFSFLHGRGVIRKFLTSKALTSIGKVSFSMYLLHMFIIILVTRYFHISSYFQTLLVFAITYILSVLSYYYIERPFINITRYKSAVSSPDIKTAKEF